MRVAALYDIHANLPALEAVLQEAAVAEVDRIVVGGDVVPGPMPREALAAAEAHTFRQFIHGNGGAVLASRCADRGREDGVRRLATLPDPSTSALDSGTDSSSIREVLRAGRRPRSRSPVWAMCFFVMAPQSEIDSFNP